MGRIDKIRHKIERAKKHIQDLDLAKRAFLDSSPNPYVVESHYYSERGDKGQTIYRVVSMEPVPEPIPLITGDAIHNLRSALDHLAYCLADVSSPHGFDESVSFFSISECVNKHEAQLGGKIKGILRQDIIEAIRRVEPYEGGKGHGDTLWRLHQLDIIDKHRLLIAVSYRFKHWGVNVTWHEVRQIAGESSEITGFGTEPAWFDPLLGTVVSPLEENQVILVAEGDMEAHTKIKFAFDIALREPTVMKANPLLESLSFMADAVDSVVASFAPFLV
jgi:hypothetical protein